MAAIGAGLAGTGFILEHRVAERFGANDLNVFLGFLYTDEDSGKSREMDIVVRDYVDPGHAYTLWISVVAECKSWSEPVVVIGRSRQSYWRARGFEEAAISGDPLVALGKSPWSSLLVSARIRDLPASVEQVGFVGTQMVLLERKSAGYRATNDGVLNSTILPVAKAMVSERNSLTEPDGETDSPPSVVLSFPILVTSGPVVEAEPDGDSINLREVGWTRISRSLNGPGLPQAIIMEVIQEKSLDRWISERLRAFVGQVEARLDLALPLFVAAGRDAKLTDEEIADALRVFDESRLSGE